MNRAELGPLPTRFFTLGQDESGVAAIEFALLSSVILLMAAVAIDGGFALLRQRQVDAAARAGAEYADLYGYDATGITTAATSATSLAVTVQPNSYCGCATGGAIAVQSCGTTCSGGPLAGSYASVTASAAYSPFFPQLWSGRLSNNLLNLSSTVVTRTN